MKSRDKHEKHIADSLKQFPPIKSSRTKEEVYEQIISTSLNKHKGGTLSPKTRFVPVFSIVLVFAILLISVPFLVNEATDNAGKIMSGEKNNFGTAQSNQMNMLKKEKDLPSYVVGSVDDTISIAHAAIANEQAKFIIPLTFVVSETDINRHYNKIADYLHDKKRLTGEYMLAGATFEINRSNRTVLVDLPKGFSLNSGAEANMFNKTVQSMFGPLQLDKAVFTRTVNLGPIGSVKELKINGLRNNAYKLYYPAQSNRSFLIPVITGGQTNITAAFKEMKQSEQEFQLHRTIPKNIQFSTRRKGNLLQVRFADNITQNQESLTMIEAILMTAKSFGYTQVEFQNTGIRKIGTYHLTDPVNVPAGVNPIQTESK